MTGQIEDLGDWVTEEEALHKWCPFARLGEAGATYNRTGPASGLHCIGSACMVWRKGVFYADDLQTRVPTELGHCGMGGRPQ